MGNGSRYAINKCPFDQILALLLQRNGRKPYSRKGTAKRKLGCPKGEKLYGTPCGVTEFERGGARW